MRPNFLFEDWIYKIHQVDDENKKSITINFFHEKSLTNVEKVHLSICMDEE